MSDAKTTVVGFNDEGTPITGDRLDMVNSPAHYQGTGGFEVIDVIEAFGLDADFCLGNAAKYILRAGKKGDAVEDLKKCAWYIQRAIYRRENGGGS